MTQRFASVKFNLLRAIEIFQDINHLDMDVQAPPSDRNYTKEQDLAEKLNDFLTDLIEQGYFDDCEIIDEDSVGSSQTDMTSSRGQSLPESEGFEMERQSSGSDGRASKESFGHRFKRYIQRILPGVGSNRSQDSRPTTEDEDDEQQDYDEEEVESEGPMEDAEPESSIASATERSGMTDEDGHSSSSSRRSRSRTRRQSGSDGQREHRRERSGSEPYDPSIVYEHRHFHKHNHPGPHHHHQHSADHQHTYHSHPDEERSRSASRSGSGRYSRRNYDYSGSERDLSADFRASYTEPSESELSSTALGSSRRSSRRSSRSASRNSSRRSASRSSRGSRGSSRSSRR